MSNSVSVDVVSEKTASSVSIEYPVSPSSASQQPCPSTPGGDSVGTHVTVPQNPFDSIVDIPPAPSLSLSNSFSDSRPIHHLTSLPGHLLSGGCEQNVHGMVTESVSPDRLLSITTPSKIIPGSPIMLDSLMHTSTSSSCDKSTSSGPFLPASPCLQALPPQPGLTHSQDQFEFTIADLTSQQSSQLVRFSSAPATVVPQPTVQQQNRINFDDDENTEPSSAANTAEQSNRESRGGAASEQQNTSELVTNTIKRFLQDTKRRISSKDARKDSDEEDMHDGALISGYLQKYGRNGKWQTRWFETDGECLSYFKSKKRSKLLATLDLDKVGNIEVDPDDSKERSFTIQVLGRMYHLRADNRAACKDWVITLNRVKEARLQQGNVKLVNRTIDLLDSEDVTPRVVVVANRQRTRAVDETEQWDQLYEMPEDPSDPAYIERRRLEGLSTTVVGRWSKRHSTLQRLGTKLARWARSVRNYSCQDIENGNVQLDRHVHPPGHDEKGLTSWGNKDSKSLMFGLENSNISPANMQQRKAGKPKRSMSSTSEDYRTIS